MFTGTPLPSIESIERDQERRRHRVEKGLAAMPEALKQLPHATDRAFYYVSPEERLRLTEMGGPAVNQMLKTFDEIYSGQDVEIFEEEWPLDESNLH